MSLSVAREEFDARSRSHAAAFGLCVVVLAVAASALAGLAPIGFSIATVFLFAGPHNWMEARFFLSRMPSRWHRLGVYFSIGIAGVLLLSLGSLLLPSFARGWQWGRGDWLIGIACWNTLLVVWIMSLSDYRRRESDGERWMWMYPAGFALIAFTWMWPLAWNLALVYLHPLVAFWFLDRELGRRRPEWRSAYRRSLLLVPVLIGMLWLLLGSAPDLPGDDLLSMQISNHAGASLLAGVSSRFLVAVHTFLEMLHYAAWIVAIPLVGYAGAPWTLQKVPLAHRSHRWKIAISVLLVLGVAITVLLWAGFIADYPLTRDVYFSVAVLHVLAEIPFLLRLL